MRTRLCLFFAALSLSLFLLPIRQAAAETHLAVDFRDDMSHDKIAKLFARPGVRVHPASRWFDAAEIYRVDVDSELDARALLSVLAQDADVEAADYDIEYAIPETELGQPVADVARGPETGFPNDPKFKFQWHMDQIRMKDAWKISQGQGVIVAVIDTGVAKVPDLDKTELVAGYNFVADSADATDDHGHGTHVAGTIAQSTHNGVGVAGIAYKAKIMPIKVLSARGSGSVSGIADGIRFAVDHGAKVINMSLGGPMASSVLEKAVKYAYEKGVTVVCAAGNDGRGRVSYPGAYAFSIAVAATQFDETTTFYSNWGKEIDIAAPGGNTRVDQNGDGMNDGVLQNTVVPGDTGKNDYLIFMGTSMASPHVAGVAALLISAGVKSPADVEKILKASARKPKVTPPDAENRYGAGLLDAAAALRMAKGAALTDESATVSSTSKCQSACRLTANPITLSVLLPFLATILLFGVRKLRGMLAALAIGMGAYLSYAGLFGHVAIAYMPDAMEQAWLLTNAVLSFGLAGLISRR